MSKLDRCKFEVEKIKHNHQEYEFPEFISQLRRALCLNRQVICDDLEMPYLKLFYLELGSFKKVPDTDILNKLAEYFDIPLSLLAKKAKDYIYDDNHSKCA